MMPGLLFDAIVVGAGFGGIGAAIQLKRQGFENFVLLDREDDLGGTWYVNHYPGLTVDVQQGQSRSEGRSAEGLGGHARGQGGGEGDQ